MVTSKQKLILLFTWLSSSCATTGPGALSSAHYADYPCEAWTDILGPSHQCSHAEGGALGPDAVAREITMRVVTEGYPLAHKEYGQASLTFLDDGNYEARKLRFTGYAADQGGRSILLVYAEDSKGRYEVEKDGTIRLDEPDFSTCSVRKSQGDTKIYPHLQTFQKEQPYRTSVPARTAIAFETNGWLLAFSGEDYWSGTTESRRDFKLPRLANSDAEPYRYQFEGFVGDIHYGCLNNGFKDFVSASPIQTRDEQKLEAGLNTRDLHKGTRLILLP